MSARPAAPWAATAAVVAGYVALVLAATLLQLPDLSGSTLGEPYVDKQNHLWDLWWWGQAARGRGAGFFYTDYLYYPPGASLWQANSGPLLFFAALPLLALGASPEAAYNLLVAASLLLSCLGGYALGRRLSGDRAVAFFLGLLAAFNPFVLGQLRVALLEFANLGFCLLCVAALHRLRERQDLRSAAWALLWFCAAAAWAWYVGLLLLLFCAVYLPCALGPWRLLTQKRRLLGLLVGWALAVGLLLAPVFYKVGVPGVEQRMQRVEGRLFAALSGQRLRVDDLSAFLPRQAAALGIADTACLHALQIKLETALDPLAALTASARDAAQADLFPGRWLLPLLLAAYALLRLRRREVWAHGVVLAVFGALALGPCVVLGGEVRFSACGLTPYALLSRVFGGLSRVQFPHRLLLPGLLSLLVLAGLGLLRALEHAGQRPGRRRALAGAASLLLLLTAWLGGGLPLGQAPIGVPRTYRAWAAAAEDFALVEVPFTRGPGVTVLHSSSLQAYYQTVHGKRQLAGPIPAYLVRDRHPPEIADNALLGLLRRLEQGDAAGAGAAAAPDLDPGQRRQALEALARHRFRFVVVHAAHLRPEVAGRVERALTALLGPPAEDRSEAEDPLRVYCLPRPPWPPGTPAPCRPAAD